MRCWKGKILQCGSGEENGQPQNRDVPSIPRTVHENPLPPLVFHATKPTTTENWERKTEKNQFNLTGFGLHDWGDELGEMKICARSSSMLQQVYTCGTEMPVFRWNYEKWKNLAHQIANEIPSSTTALTGRSFGQRTSVEIHCLRAVTTALTFGTPKSGFKAHMPAHGSIRICATKISVWVMMLRVYALVFSISGCVFVLRCCKRFYC